MSKKKIKIKKTLPEQILEKAGISFESIAFEIIENEEGKRVNHGELDENTIYKTLALSGNVTGTLIGILPITAHLDYKKLAIASNNKKVGMLPLKDLQKTTGYVHGANNPVGIWKNKHFPIFIDNLALEQKEIIVSAGEIGRSLKINAEVLADFVEAKFVDLRE
ncbi:Cys-tRNA(Pro)/Cys-tRNA(Cys) deacylase [Pilibacter termitis]|uniref:Cys-tRNA(Pro)/Cys-tRNA(Cys) deacylase n=1 Tax=Pilibacter termitis TaxID=263852 RepID=A0A1T4RFW7_9ENTE|nr:aminoacyl-tRNA deacylase [Pilibacter termitis]SKA14875.1 Cys-tRNA(Pro)/Cys-tRNA(Cys) deacylase [Pilibacter termitis]